MEPDRMEALKGIIKELHAGGSVDELQRRFAALVRDVSSSEIAEMERQLIAEGMPEMEVKRLCDLHTRVLEPALAKQPANVVPPGHPLEALVRENVSILDAVAQARRLLDALGPEPGTEELASHRRALADVVRRIGAVEAHYLFKEYRLFPVLEKHGVVAPPKVMWATHDDARALLKKVGEAVRASEGGGEVRPADPKGFVKNLGDLAVIVAEMVSKEEKILFPLCLELFTPEEWQGVTAEGVADPRGARGGPAAITLDTGVLTAEQVRLLFGHLPVDVTFVDENDEVRFYSEGKRVFPRAPGVIGRRVQNCHPPKSVHIVERILREFRAGERDVAEFWLEVAGRFVYIRYFAVRDAAGTYRGTLEVVQDVTEIRRLEGQKRLLD